MILLSDAENRMIVASFVSTQYQLVSEVLWLITSQTVAYDSRRPHLNSLARGDPLRISRRSLPLQKLEWFATW